MRPGCGRRDPRAGTRGCQLGANRDLQVVDTWPRRGRRRVETTSAWLAIGSAGDAGPATAVLNATLEAEGVQ